MIGKVKKRNYCLKNNFKIASILNTPPLSIMDIQTTQAANNKNIIEKLTVKLPKIFDCTGI